jgi:hypothetical protein
MSYKFSGVASHDCTVYVINTSDDSIETVQAVSAGAYEIDTLELLTKYKENKNESNRRS